MLMLGGRRPEGKRKGTECKVEHVDLVRRDHWGAKVFTEPRETFNRGLSNFCNREVQTPTARASATTEFEREAEILPTKDTKGVSVIDAKERATGNTQGGPGQVSQAEPVEA